jgi:predicted nucleic acid-binding protein
MVQIRSSHKSLSIYDISAFVLAQDQRIILLTGDETLRKFSESSGVEVHGILWILDEIIQNEIMSKPDAARALRQMMSHDSFLPKKECEDRLAQWS